MLENAGRTELSELGEFGLIQHLTQHVSLHHKSTLRGIGDDGAVLDYQDGITVVSSDMLVEGIHFDLTYVPLKHLGYKAVVVNLSDIYAMNAIPEHITVNLAVSSRFPVEALEELYNGIQLACERYKVDLVGGDTSSSRQGLILSVTAIGKTTSENIAYRSGAREKDLLCVSGDLGAAYMGLQILEREKSVFQESSGIQPQLDGFDYLLERQLKPEARKEIIAGLAEKKIVPTAMIDVSDGLASEIIHVCSASNVGCEVYEEKIPLDHLTVQTAEEFNLSPLVAALHGGEDYELLFTVPLDAHEQVQALPGVSVIGHMTAAGSGANLVGSGGNSIPLDKQGWNAFSKQGDHGVH